MWNKYASFCKRFPLLAYTFGDCKALLTIGRRACQYYEFTAPFDSPGSGFFDIRGKCSRNYNGRGGRLFS